MKNLYSRTSVALACALILVACGGKDGNLVLGGSITGVTKSGLTLSNNGGPALPIPPGTSQFQFPELIGSDEKYNVQVKDLPEGMKCNALYNTGTSGAYNVTSVQFGCFNLPRNLTGKVTGLNVNGLILNNGKDQVIVPAGATSFTFTKTEGTTTTGTVGDGEPFGVTVLQQPKPQNCTVSNGAGFMGHVDYTAVVVTCN